MYKEWHEKERRDESCKREIAQRFSPVFSIQGVPHRQFICLQAETEFSVNLVEWLTPDDVKGAWDIAEAHGREVAIPVNPSSIERMQEVCKRIGGAISLQCRVRFVVEGNLKQITWPVKVEPVPGMMGLETQVLRVIG
jgi:hypothetical protein